MELSSELETLPIQPPREESRALQVGNLSFRFRSQDKNLFTSLSFAVGTGERVALTGPNGIGKSTLFRVLLDESAVEGKTSGSVHFWGAPFCRSSPRVGLVGDLKTSEDYHGLPYGYPVKELLDIQSELAPCREGLLIEALHSVLNISSMIAGRTDELSSGQRKRLQLYLALAKHSDLILADEPFENVDVDRSLAMQLLREFLTEHRIALLLITHRKEEAEFLCDSLYEFTADGCERKAKRPLNVGIQLANGTEFAHFEVGGPAEMAWRLQMNMEAHPECVAQVTVKPVPMGRSHS